MDIVSNCCSAGIYENTDICMECKEHCEEIDLDEEDLDEEDYPQQFGYDQRKL